MRGQLDVIFKLLADFARLQPAYYGAVRDELVSWALLREDPVISARAERHALDLADWYEEALDRALPHRGPGAWAELLTVRADLDTLGRGMTHRHESSISVRPDAARSESPVNEPSGTRTPAEPELGRSETKRRWLTITDPPRV